MEKVLKGKCGDYFIFPTQDGSFTLWNSQKKEAMHSSAGAVDETLMYYIQGCQLEKKDNIVLLEVGFGIGLGYKTTIQFLDSLENSPSLYYLGLERDPALLNIIRENVNQTRYACPSELEGSDQKVSSVRGHNELHILWGDARKTLYDNKNKLPLFNAIYQDAFSPKKNPELWSVEWFKLLKEVSDPSCLLSTFSSASSVRKGLYEAQWNVHFGPGMGRKECSTRASLQGEISIKMQEKFKRSTSMPIREMERGFYGL